MQDTAYEAWREKGRRIGRHLLEALDMMALEEAIRASERVSDPTMPVHPEQANAYRIGLRDVLREYRQAAKQT